MVDEALIAQLNRGYVCPPDAGPAWRAAHDAGIDMSLIEHALELTPAERLDEHQQVLDFLLTLEEQGWRMAQNNQSLLTRLRQNSLDFVVIGGVCSVYYGVPIATFDLDICCRFNEENLWRIEAAVRDLHPTHRLTPQKLPLELTSELCSQLKNLYLQTDLGKLDCLSQVAGIGGYDEVFQQSRSAEFPYGTFRFLTLEALIAAKQAVGRERDLEVLKHLRAIKEKLAQKAMPPKPQA